MPKGRNNWITDAVAPVVMRMYRNTGRAPKVAEIIDFMPELEGHQDTVRKAIKSTIGKLPPSVVEVAEAAAKTPDRLKTLQQVMDERKKEADPLEPLEGDLETPASGKSWLYSHHANLLKILNMMSKDGLEGGRVDAIGIDKITKTILDVEAQIKQRELEAKTMGNEDESYPVWDQILKTHEARTARGENRPRPKSEVEGGVSLER